MKKLLFDLVRALSMQFVILLLMVVIFALGYILRKDILISYHRWGEKSSAKAMLKYRNSDQKDLYRRYLRQTESHHEALIELGFYEIRIFNTTYLKMSSPEFRKMMEEFIKLHPNSSCSLSGRDGFTITDRPEFMPVWESLIKKYDVPSEEPNQPIIPDELYLKLQ